MKFVGREHELRLLEEHYSRSQASLVPIYGRRRVGKSRLIDEFIKGKPSIYFLGKTTTAGLQIDEFRDAAQLLIKDPALGHARFKGWQEALITVTKLWRGGSKLVIVLDELQWTAEASPELVSVLHSVWEQEWKPRKDVMVILCGSHLGFMEKEILGEKSPLFGRRSDQIRLGPLPFSEAAQMVEHYGEADRAGVYFLVGGIPAYLERFVSGRTLPQAIAEEFCSDLRFFALEPQFLVSEELRDPSRYFAILTNLAEKRLRQKELAERSQMEARALPFYLSTLLELGYIAKSYPVIPGKVNPRQVLYEIADPLLSFWFRFVFPNLQLCRPGQEQSVFDRCIRPQLDSYFGLRFEKLCQEELIRFYQRKRILWQDIGQYWEKTFQIDVAAIRKDHWIDLGECKWGGVRSLKGVAADLEQKVQRYPNKHGWSFGRHIFLRRQTQERIPNTHIHYLTEMLQVQRDD